MEAAPLTGSPEATPPPCPRSLCLLRHSRGCDAISSPGCAAAASRGRAGGERCAVVTPGGRAGEAAGRRHGGAASCGVHSSRAVLLFLRNKTGRRRVRRVWLGFSSKPRHKVPILFHGGLWLLLRCARHRRFTGGMGRNVSL